MEVDYIRLVDINQSTVEETWPLLLTAVEQASFIAIDLELSGLGRHITKGATQPDDKYKALRKVVSSYAIVSMGVACFQWQPVSSTAVPCRAEVFNLLLLSQHSYTMDPSSAQFLLKHGFDFNKQLRYGLPFTPVGGGGPFTGKLVELFYHILLSSAPLVLHNGWLDLLHLYNAFHAPLPMSHDSLVADLTQLTERGGVYDTKAIARYQQSEESSFLEYIYKKALVQNSRSSEELYFELLVPDYPTLASVAMEMILLPRIPDVAPKKLEELKVCQSIIRRGVCEAVECVGCHDVTMAILQELHWRDNRQQKRKRKRERSAQSLVELFQEELSEAHCRLDPSHMEQVSMTTDVSCDLKEKSCDKQTKSCDVEKRSCGHRAGFDAFMTGYTFACYCIQSLPSPQATPTEMTVGLDCWRNCLNNRWNTPIRIAASRYSRPSHAHTAVWTGLQHTS